MRQKLELYQFSEVLHGSPLGAGYSENSHSRQVKETVKQIEILRRHAFIDSAQHVAGWALQRTWKTSPQEKLMLASLADANTQVNALFK